MKTFGQLQNEILKTQSLLSALINDQKNSIGYFFVNYVFNNEDFFKPLAEQLVESLNNRDEPMSFDDIKKVFEYSGFDYTENHILECHPDNAETIAEQIAYYRE